LFGVLINMGSSNSKPNGRGRIFKDLSFDYLPIPETKKTRETVPTYRDLGFANVRFPDLPVHLDPEFETFTYGHVRRGFGDMKNLLRLEEDVVLFFHATLQREYGWSVYIIGYFNNIEVCDCRKLSDEEILRLESKGFTNNAHLKRVHPSVNLDLLIKGGKGSRLLNNAFPLAEENDNLTLRRTLGNIIHTAGGEKIKSGTPWFRWTLTCRNPDQLLKMIST